MQPRADPSKLIRASKVLPEVQRRLRRRPLLLRRLHVRLRHAHVHLSAPQQPALSDEELLVRIIFVFVAIGALVICCVCCEVYITLQHGASRPRAKTLPAWLSRGPSSWLQASRTPRVDFGEEGINMLTVRVSHQMASQI